MDKDNQKRLIESYFNNLTDMQTSKEITDKECIQTVKNTFKKNWYMSYDYNIKNLKTYTGNELKEKYKKDIVFKSIIVYTSMLFDYLQTGDTISGIESWIYKEIEEWEIKGGNCIYFSMLIIALLRFYNYSCIDCIEYVQGYYIHDVRDDYPSFLPFQGKHMGLHSFVVFDTHIMDVSIKQESYFFDFHGEHFVLGKAPKGMIYKGFRESSDVIQKNTNDICKFSNMDYKNWIRYHAYNSLRLTKTVLEKIYKY
jgi:hypothetical protein